MEKIRAFNIKLPLSIWVALKKNAAQQELTMTEIIKKCIEKYNKKFENKLTTPDTDV